jgi:hypothetical protein
MSRVTIADDGNVWLNGRLTRWVMLRDSGEWKGVRASLAEGGRVVVRCASERAARMARRKARRGAGGMRCERLTETELDLIRRWVPIYGVRVTANALDRDPSGVARHARRLGVKSPHSRMAA